MNYYFVADFGTSHSGCACMSEYDESPWLLHKKRSVLYAKEETIFAIERDFLNSLVEYFDEKSDSDFRILSDTENLNSTIRPNIVWREDSLSRFDSENFVRFSHFKMGLYSQNDKRKNTILGSDGNEYSISLIIKIFLRVLKIDAHEAFKAMKGFPVDKTDIEHWGLTVPSIWGFPEKQLMRDIALSVYGDNVTIISEPHGALAYFLNSNRENDRVSVVIDAGGGTVDMACIVESFDKDGKYTFKSIELPNGEGAAGDDIDNEFWMILCDIMVQESKSEDRYEKEPDLYQVLIGDYIDSSIKRRNTFYASWRKIQHDYYGNNERENLSFVFAKDYYYWLLEKGHDKIARYLREELLSMPISPNCVIDAHDRVISDKIIPKVESFINKSLERVEQIDQIVLAGGLSFTSVFQDAIQKLVEENDRIDGQALKLSAGVYEAKYSAIEKFSGAVLLGAVLLLAHPELMVFTAVKSVYYDCYSSENNLIEKRMEEYGKFDFASILSPFKKKDEQHQFLRQKLKEYEEKTRCHKTYRKNMRNEDRVLVLHPICVRGCMAANFKETLYPMKQGQKDVEIDLYVSDNPYILYCSDKNSELIKLDTISIPIGDYITMEFKLNDAQNANPIEVIVTDDRGNLVKFFKIQSKFRKGY